MRTRTEAFGVDVNIKCTRKDQRDIFKYVVYTQYEGKWTYRTLNAKSSFFQVSKVVEVNAKTKASAKLTAFKVTAIDRSGNESAGEIVTL